MKTHMIFGKINTSEHKRGFTLIELIVVIAIIGLLASVVMSALGISRTRAEIAKMLTDYKSVANGLELYRQAHAGQYPTPVANPAHIRDLIENNGILSEYIKQTPSTSSNITADGTVLYYLNDTDLSQSRYWCGETDTPQDYIIYFNNPTSAATDSGFFQTISSGIPGDSLNTMDNALCIPVNQK